MNSSLSNHIAKQTGVSRHYSDDFLSKFSDSILLAAEKGVAKTPLFRISKLANKTFKPSVNPSSRLRGSISLMPLNSDLVSVFSESLELDDSIVIKMFIALMEIGKQQLCMEGKFLIPNTVKMEARLDGVIRIVSLKRIKQASTAAKDKVKNKSSTVEDLGLTH